jgi:hypothetical protein
MEQRADERRTPNIELPILRALRFIDFKMRITLTTLYRFSFNAHPLKAKKSF